MFRPTKTDIPSLLGKKSAEHAEWLRTGLADFLFGSRSRHAFPGADDVIGGPDHIDDELAAVGEALPPHDRHRFIAGLWQALSGLDWLRDDEALIARILLSVAEKLEARDALGEVMAAALAQARPNAAPPTTRALFERVLDFAEQFASATRPETADEVVRLHNALGATFPIGKVRAALLAMCKARPELAPTYIRSLEADLDKVFGGADNTTEAERLRRIREALIVQLGRN
jgi:hypothetical protein